MRKRPIYMDYAATTPLDPEIFSNMKPYFSDKFYNPSATYLAGRAVKQDINQARSAIARQLGVRGSEIFFTAGATEANNLAIRGVMYSFEEADLLVSSVEHESVIAPARLFNHKKIPVDKNGVVDIIRLQKLITEGTVLVSVMLVNNELGAIQPIKEVAALIKKIRTERLNNSNINPLYFHTDAAQAGNYLDLHVSRLGVDMMSINGGKIYGPKQSGVLFVRAGISLQPLILGGGQEGGLRSGTENVAFSVGLASALTKAQRLRNSESRRINDLKAYFISNINSKLPDVIINGLSKSNAPHIVHLTFPGEDNERLMMELDERGIQCAVGSACSAQQQESSHVLEAIGMNDKLARSSLRFSFGRYTTKKEIDYLLRELEVLRS